MAIDHAWFTIPSEPTGIDFDYFKPALVVSFFQKSVGAAQDGIIGANTLTELLQTAAVDEALAAGTPNAAVMRSLRQAIGAVAPGQALPPAVWQYMASLGMHEWNKDQVLANRFNLDGFAVQGAGPTYRGDRSVVAPAPTPNRRAPVRPPAPRTPPALPPGAAPPPGRTGLSGASTSLASRVSEMYANHKTAFWAVGGLMVAGGIAVVMMNMEDDPQRLPGGPQGPRAPGISMSRARAAAEMLGISLESDAQSIRSAAARALKAYQGRTPRDDQKRAMITDARDTLLAWHGANVRQLSAAR